MRTSLLLFSSACRRASAALFSVVSDGGCQGPAPGPVVRQVARAKATTSFFTCGTVSKVLASASDEQPEVYSNSCLLCPLFQFGWSVRHLVNAKSIAVLHTFGCHSAASGHLLPVLDQPARLHSDRQLTTWTTEIRRQRRLGFYVANFALSLLWVFTVSIVSLHPDYFWQRFAEVTAEEEELKTSA